MPLRAPIGQLVESATSMLLNLFQNVPLKILRIRFCRCFFASRYLIVYFVNVLLIFFINLLNPEIKFDYLIKRQKQCTIFDYLLNSQKR